MTNAKEPPHGTDDFLHFRRDEATGIEALAARFHSHAYDMHFHDEWLVGVTHQGVQDFFCRGQRRQSVPGKIILIEPEEKHDGQAVRADGFSYSMLYLPRSWIRSEMGDRDDDIGFKKTLAEDQLLANAIAETCRAILSDAPRLAVEECRGQVSGLLRRHLGKRVPELAEPVSDCLAPEIADRAMEFLRARFDEEFGLDELTVQAGAENRFQLARSFKRRFGISPHAFQVHLRLVRARALLRQQFPPADVAALNGFSDQSHMGRWFRRTYGITPAAYRRGCTNVPDLDRYIG